MTEAERLAKALVNSHGYIDSKGAWRVVRNEDAEQAAALLRSQARYIKDMEDTISKIAGLVGAKDADAAIEAVRSQAAELEALRADAERWRWWRRWFRTLTTYDVARAVGLDLTRIYVTTPEQMDKVTDAAIDAARQS